MRYSIEKPRVYLGSNIIGSFNVIEASHKVKVKHLIMASSSSVYGANKNIPFKEIDKTESQLSIYAATKKANESMAHSYSNIGKSQSLCLDSLLFMVPGKTRYGFI